MNETNPDTQAIEQTQENQETQETQKPQDAELNHAAGIDDGASAAERAAAAAEAVAEQRDAPDTPEASDTPEAPDTPEDPPSPDAAGGSGEQTDPGDGVAKQPIDVEPGEPAVLAGEMGAGEVPEAWHGLPASAMGSVFLVLQERSRQIAEEGFTAELDDQHVQGELARAAACYALPPVDRMLRGRGVALDVVQAVWPFSPSWFKSEGGAGYHGQGASEAVTAEGEGAEASGGASGGGRTRDLVKAAALLLAEIDRRLRAQRRLAEGDDVDLDAELDAAAPAWSRTPEGGAADA